MAIPASSHGFGKEFFVILSSKKLWCNGLVQIFSLPIAMQNLAWGIFGIFAGMVTNKLGLFRVLVAGAVFYSLGLVGTANAADYDVCADTNLKLDAQTEADANFIVQQLQAGNPNFTNMFAHYQDMMKTRDKYPASPAPYQTNIRALMSALHCKDPTDVTITTPLVDRAPDKKIDFSIDVWKPKTNEIFEDAKRFIPLTPGIIQQANNFLKNNIPPEDRDLAVAHFNHRAHLENKPMELIQDSKTGNLELRTKDGGGAGNSDSSKAAPLR
jgi:hypothetical protein